jgi:predicted ArsR family transcriptional regulator
VQGERVAEDAIPDEVKAFIAAHIESVLQLEILLLLHGRAPRQWTAAELAQELRIDAAWASNQLAGLADAGVLGVSAAAAPEATGPAYRYEPRSQEMDRAVAGLAREYEARRVTIIGLIFSKPIDKLRSFADAFRIRKDKTDG